MSDHYAKWMVITHYLDRDEYECSSCHTVCKEALYRCPSCGALMRKGEKDQNWVEEAAFLDFMFGD